MGKRYIDADHFRSKIVWYLDRTQVASVQQVLKAVLWLLDNEEPILSDEQVSEVNLYDIEEVHHGCTVQVLTNSVTGETSVGWWKGDADVCTDRDCESSPEER